MSEQEEIDLFRRIRENIRQTQRALFERKARLGEPLVMSGEDGKPMLVSGEEALRRLDEIESK